MKKIKSLAIFIFMALLTVTSCSVDDNTQNEIDNSINKEAVLLNKEAILLQKTYDFDNIDLQVDMSYNLSFKSAINLSEIAINKSKQDLNLINVTQINWKNKEVSYIVPFKANPKKSIVITIGIDKVGKTLNYRNEKIVENLIDPNTGNGKIIITDTKGTKERVFKQGILVNKQDGSAKTFRECFDDAYDAICDGFIGCASWYSSPLPALTAVAYCGITTA